MMLMTSSISLFPSFECECVMASTPLVRRPQRDVRGLLRGLGVAASLFTACLALKASLPSSSGAAGVSLEAESAAATALSAASANWDGSDSGRGHGTWARDHSPAPSMAGTAATRASGGSTDGDSDGDSSAALLSPHPVPRPSPSPTAERLSSHPVPQPSPTPTANPQNTAQSPLPTVHPTTSAPSRRLGDPRTMPMHYMNLTCSPTVVTVCELQVAVTRDLMVEALGKNASVQISASYWAVSSGDGVSTKLWASLQLDVVRGERYGRVRICQLRPGTQYALRAYAWVRTPHAMPEVVLEVGPWPVRLGSARFGGRVCAVGRAVGRAVVVCAVGRADGQAVASVRSVGRASGRSSCVLATWTVWHCVTSCDL